MSRRDGETGMILVNVLMFVAIASAMVLLMVNREELALDRGLRMREASRALAAARGGELSALVALRRDALVAPNVDHVREPWAALSESGAPIEGGTFDLAIGDAEGRFNVNSLRTGEAASTGTFLAIAEAVGLPEDQTEQAIVLVRTMGPITDLRPLRMAGFDPAVVARLEPLVTALPGHTTINLNAAGEALLAILFRDPVVAQRLVAVRERQGFLTAKDLADAKVSLPFGTSFRSGSFWVRTRATIGGTSQEVATLIRRVPTEGGGVEVIPVERWRGAAVPPEVPAFR